MAKPVCLAHTEHFFYEWGLDPRHQNPLVACLKMPILAPTPSFYPNGPLSVVPKLAASASSGTRIKLQMFSFLVPGLPESDILGVGPQNLCWNDLSRGLWNTEYLKSTVLSCSLCSPGELFGTLVPRFLEMGPRHLCFLKLLE